MSGSTTTATLTTIASFDGTGLLDPQNGLLVDANGNVFGTSYVGGSYNQNGAVFEIAAGSGSISVLASFNGNNGTAPWGGLIEDAAGNLFGSTIAGGALGSGTVFEISATPHSLTTLANNFNGRSIQNLLANPEGSLVEDSNGNLFGIAQAVDSDGHMGVFEIASGTSSATLVTNLDLYGPSRSLAGLTIDPNGNLYGTFSAQYFGSYGGVYEIAANSHSVTTLAFFNGINGSNPFAGVMIDAHGNLFGTTNSGGAYNKGVIFELAAGTQSLTALASFNGTNGTGDPSSDGNNGAYPYGGVIEDAAGNLFGTTTAGGTNGYGTVFELAAGSQSVTTLVNFTHDQQGSVNGLAADGHGNLYGVALTGSTDAIFEIANTGFYVTSHTPSPAIPSSPTITQENAGGYSATGALTITGTAVNGSIVTIYDGTTQIGTTTADAATGAYSLALSTPLADGPHSINATATLNGLTSAPSGATSVTVDSAAPVVTISTAPATVSSATQTISGTVTDLAAGTTVSIYDNGSTTALATATIGVGGAWSANVTLGAGANSLVAEDTNLAGTTGSSAAVIETYTPPPPAPSAPNIIQENTNGYSPTGALTIIGTAVAGSTVTLYDGTTEIGTAIAAATGDYSVALATPLVDGPHSIDATATLNGLTSAASTATSVTVDSAAPVVTITTAPAIVSSATQTISGTVTDLAAGTTVSIYDNGSTTALASATIGDGGAWSADVTLATGANSLVAQGTNLAGTTGSSSTVVETYNLPSGNADGSGSKATLITANSSGQEANGGSPLVNPDYWYAWSGFPSSDYNYQISPDGSSVLFESDANNLVAALGDVAGQLYIKSLQTGIIADISTSANGTPANGVSYQESFSPNGQDVVFISEATNLVGGVTGGRNVYEKNLETGNVTWLSQAASTSPTADFMYPTFSPNGQEVAWSGYEQDGNTSAVFVENLQTGAITNFNWIGDSFDPTWTPDGSSIVFSAFNYGGNATSDQLIQRKLTTGQETILSSNSSGVADPGGDDPTVSYGTTTSFNPVYSSDGSFILFDSSTPTLVPNDTNEARDIFEKNLTTGQVTLISTNAAGQEGNSNSQDPQLSPNNQWVLFESSATNLTSAATGGNWNVYLKNLLTGDVYLVSTGMQGASFGAKFSPDGSTIYFLNSATTGPAQHLPENMDSQIYGISLNSVLSGKPVAPPAPNAPTVTQENAFGYSSTGTLTITGTAADGSTVMLYDGTTKIGTTSADATTGAYILTLTNPLGDGTHSIDATATLNGLTSAASGATSVLIDSAAPVVTISNASATVSSPSQTISGTVIDLAPGSTVSIYDNGSTTALATATIGAGGAWSANVTLAVGPNSLVAQDTNLAGLTGSSAPVGVTVSAAPNPNPSPTPSTNSPTVKYGTYAATSGTSIDLTDEINSLITPGAAGDTETIVSFDANLVKNSAGRWIYTVPNLASDNVVFSVTDQNGHSATGQVSVTITSPQGSQTGAGSDPGPHVNFGAATATVGSQVDLTATINSLITPGLVGDHETITSLDTNLVQNSAGHWIYTTPNSASDNVVFRVTDQNGSSALGLVAVTISSASSGPSSGGSGSAPTFSGYDSHYTQAAGDNTAITITDTVGGSGSAAGAFFTLNNGNNTLVLSGSYDHVTLGSGYSEVSGSNGHLILTATGADKVAAGGYNNQITLGAGDSIVDAGLGYSTVSVGDTTATGETTITAAGNQNVITTAGGTDVVTLTGGGWNNVINAGAGATTVTGGYANTYNVTALPTIGGGLTVTDFNAAYGDVLNLSVLEAGLAPGYTIGGTNTGSAFDVTIATGGSTYTVAVLQGVGSGATLASLQASHSILS